MFSRRLELGVIALATAFLIGPTTDRRHGAEFDAPDEPIVVEQLRALGFDVVDPVATDSAGAADSGAADSGGIEAPDLDDTARLAGHIRRAATGGKPGQGTVALVDRRFIGHTHALRQAVSDTRWKAATAPGVVAVTPSAAGALAAAVEAVGTDDLARLAAELQRELGDRLTVQRIDPAPFVAGVAADTSDREALEARVDAVDEEKLRLQRAVKADDTFFTAMTVRKYSGYAARWLAGLGISPNLVTVLSLAVAIVAAGAAATGTRVGFVVAALLFHAAFALDCIDGDLARYTLHYSKLGSWLDATFDRVKEYVLFAGLAIGGMQVSEPGDMTIWALAAGAMALQTVRHAMHFAYEEVSAGPDGAPPLSAEVQAKLTGAQWKIWLRRAVVLPQGERSALICLLVAFTTPSITFIVLLVAGILAGAYGTLGRLLRSLKRLHRGWSRRAARALGAMVDVGPVGWILHFALPGRSLPAPVTTLIALLVVGGGLGALATLGVSGVVWLPVVALWYALLVGFSSRQPLNGWADWVLPPSYRTAEYAVVLITTLVIDPGALPLAFAFVAASAYHQYDTVYRLRGAGTVPPRWLVVITGGHEGRIIVLSLLALGGPTAWTIGLGILAAWLAVVFVAESIANTVEWVRSSHPEEHEELRAPDEQGDQQGVRA